MSTTPAGGWQLWASELSPFALKVASLLRHAGLPYRWLPAQGARRENLRRHLQVGAMRRGWLALQPPLEDAQAELPLVPYLFGPQGERWVDSTRIAHLLDQRLPTSRRTLPGDPLAAFVVQLLEDYADEFGLYLVHHQRWVVSAADNDAGQRLAAEFANLIGPAQPLMAQWFARRQTRRLAYLFSVPPDVPITGTWPHGRPPRPAGFPPTHSLLEQAWQRLCAALEALLQRRPFVLGGRYTLADAALYGQLGMNLADPSTAQRLQTEFPTVHRWLQQLHRHAPSSRADAPLQVDAALQPLLVEAANMILPLLQQNAAAHARYLAQGQRRWNEAAFTAGEACYDGVLAGQPYRAVVKAFQVPVWRGLVARYAQLPAESKAALQALLGTGCDLRVWLTPPQPRG